MSLSCFEVLSLDDQQNRDSDLVIQHKSDGFVSQSSLIKAIVRSFVAMAMRTAGETMDKGPEP
jgi:hypothetical protein